MHLAPTFRRFCLAFLLLGGFLFNLAQAQNYYVLAPSGLNLRATSDPGSSKLATIPYGTKVSIHGGAIGVGTGDMVIDNLKGEMVEVTANGKKGYMFSGFLAPYPAGKKNEGTEKYVERLRLSGKSSTYEEHKYDYDGVYSYEEVFYLDKGDFQGAFLVAKGLYGIPKGFKFPDPNSRKAEEHISNPNKDELAWVDEMTVRREGGKITSIIYGWRGEGSGWSVEIATYKDPDGMMEQIKVSYGAVAD